MDFQTVTDHPEYYALITGASSGIGKAMAKECARRRMNLFLVALPSSGLPELSEELSTVYGVKSRFLEIDLTLQNAHQEVLQFSKINKLTVKVLINNVGIGFNGRLEGMAENDVFDMLTLNIRLTTMLTKVFLPELKMLPSAYILNMGSLAGFVPLSGKSVYSASKAYVFFITRAMTRELKGSGVSVSGVFPAGVPTNNMVIQRIARMGWLARNLVSSPESVAREAIGGMLKGRSVIFPGKRLKSFFYLGCLLPQGLVIKLLANEFIHSK